MVGGTPLHAADDRREGELALLSSLALPHTINFVCLTTTAYQSCLQVIDRIAVSRR